MNNIPLQKHFNKRLKAIYKYIDVKIESIDRSTNLAADALEKRLESMNEFRNSLKDQQSKFVTREEYALMHERLVEDVKILREAKANFEGKASMASVYLSYVIAAIALAISIIRIFI